PAPARFSISTRLPSCVSSWAASGRAKASVPPPAANGTMKVIGFSGHDCAWAWLVTVETHATSANRARLTILGSTVLSPGYAGYIRPLAGFDRLCHVISGRRLGRRRSEPCPCMQDAVHDWANRAVHTRGARRGVWSLPQGRRGDLTSSISAQRSLR